MNTLTQSGYEANKDVHSMAIGGGVYAMATAVWLGIALALGLVSGVLLVTAVPILILLLMSIQTARRLPPSPANPQKASIGKWFGIIFAWEGILIGVGSGILLALDQPNLILSWVAFIVGLHFFPLGYLLRLKGDYLLGAAIVLLVIVTLSFDLATRQMVLTFGTAVFLWLAGVGRLLIARSGRSEKGETAVSPQT